MYTLADIYGKHLPGRHDQSAHGHGGSGNDDDSSKPSKPGRAFTAADVFPAGYSNPSSLADKIVSNDFSSPEDAKKAELAITNAIEDVTIRFPATKDCLSSLSKVILVDKERIIESSDDNVLKELQFSRGESSNARGRYCSSQKIIGISRTPDVAEGVHVGTNWDSSKSIFLGSHNTTRCPADTARHEFGHHVYYNLFKDDGYDFKLAIQDAYNYYETDFRKTISVYSRTNKRELFAESFAVYTHPQYKRGMLPKQMETILNKYIGGRTKKKEVGLLFIIKHLPGRHDQSTHGSRDIDLSSPPKRDEEFYHGTVDSYALKIMREGLTPNHKKNFDSGCYTGDRANSVFVTHSFDNALGYALKMKDEFKEKKGKEVVPVVLKVKMKVSDLKEDELDPSSMRREGKISPEMIVAFTTNRGKEWHDVSKKAGEEIMYVPLVIVVNEKEEKEVDNTITKVKAKAKPKVTKKPDKAKTEFVFRTNTSKYEKQFQKVMIDYFKDQEKAALSVLKKELDEIEQKHGTGDQKPHGHRGTGKGTTPRLIPYDPGLSGIRPATEKELSKVAKDYEGIPEEIRKWNRTEELAVGIISDKSRLPVSWGNAVLLDEKSVQEGGYSRINQHEMRHALIHNSVINANGGQNAMMEQLDNADFRLPIHVNHAYERNAKSPTSKVDEFLAVIGDSYDSKLSLGDHIDRVTKNSKYKVDVGKEDKFTSVYTGGMTTWTEKEATSAINLWRSWMNIASNKSFNPSDLVQAEFSSEVLGLAGVFKQRPVLEGIEETQKSYFPFDSIEEHVLMPSIGLTRVFPRKKKVVQKGGPGSGSWEGPGQPRFAREGNKEEEDLFHGTTEKFAENILKEGLVVGPTWKTQGVKGVYATPKKLDAFAYAEYAGRDEWAKTDRLPSGIIVVLKSKPFTISVDNDLQKVTDNSSVSPEYIKRIEVYSHTNIRKVTLQIANKVPENEIIWPTPDNILYPGKSSKQLDDKEFYLSIMISESKKEKTLEDTTKSYFPFDSIEEHVLMPSIGLTRVFPRKKKVVQKGGPGSGSWEGPGKPRFARGPNSENDKVPDNQIPDKVYVGLLADWYDGWEGMSREAIKVGGLKPGVHSNFSANTRPDSVYVATNYAMARAYSTLYSNPLVLEIDVSKLKKDSFYYDPMDVPINGKLSQLAYRGTIPSEAITPLRVKKSIDSTITKASPNALPDRFDFSDWAYKDSKWNKRLQEEGGLFIKEVYEREGKRVWDDLSLLLEDGLEGTFDIDNPLIKEFIESYSYKFAQGINETTVGSLRAAMASGMEEGLGMDGIAKLIQDVFTNASKYRSLLIARTETIRASNGAAREAYRQSEVVEGIEWLVTRDDRLCPFCSAMPGKIVSLDENYFELGDSMTIGSGTEKATMKFDYEAVGYPPLHPSCRCTVIPRVYEEYRLPKGIGLDLFFKGGPGSGIRGHRTLRPQTAVGLRSSNNDSAVVPKPKKQPTLKESSDAWEDYGEGWLIKSISKGEKVSIGDTDINGSEITQERIDMAKQHVSILQKAASSNLSKHPGLYRGEVFSSQAEIDKKYPKGRGIKMMLDGLTSTSSNKELAMKYTDGQFIGAAATDKVFPVLVRISGRKGKVTGFDRPGDFPETILAKGNKYLLIRSGEVSVGGKKVFLVDLYESEANLKKDICLDLFFKHLPGQHDQQAHAGISSSTAATQDDSESLFHGTLAQNVAKIKKEGIKAQWGAMGSGVYASDEKSAYSWAVTRWCQKHQKNPEEAGPNVKVAVLKLKKEGFADVGMGDFLSKGDIPPEKILDVKMFRVRDYMPSYKAADSDLYLGILFDPDFEKKSIGLGAIFKGKHVADNIEEWRELCLDRDKHKCKRCGTKEGVFVHHVKPKETFPGLRLVVSNGETICRPCHAKRHDQTGPREETK